MPANQFFTDWVTGDIITADKLNTMKNEVQPYLGYTPLNKAGDTWTGDLIGGNLYASRYLGIIGDINEAKWFFHTGDYSTYLFNDNSDTSALPGVPNQTLSGRTYRAKAAFRPDGSLDVAGEYRGRYDHQNRFVLQNFITNAVTVPANSNFIIASVPISLPSGKSVYLRRVRWVVGSQLLPRVQSTNTWTGPLDVGDSTMNVLMTSINFMSVSLRLVNNTSNPVTALQGWGIWAELEIR